MKKLTMVITVMVDPAISAPLARRTIKSLINENVDGIRIRKIQPGAKA